MHIYEKFSDHPIWERTGKRVDWYRSVSINRMPAKYNIAKYVDTKIENFSEIASVEDAINIYVEKTADFISLKKSIESGKKLSALEIPNYSLLDLAMDTAQEMLKKCVFCRWLCKVDRKKGETLGACMLTDESRVSSFFHHRGEELIFRGTNGSGTIFFTSCNMRCLFCQNSDISRDRFNGIPFSDKELAQIVYALRLEGCHNANFVGGEPSIHLHSIVGAIWNLGNIGFDLKPNTYELGKIMRVKSDFTSFHWDKSYADYEGMFNMPILFNTNMFLSDEGLAILRPLVDIWLPDFKFGPGKCAVRLSRTPWYYETVSKNLKTVYDWGEDVLVRHLIMPNHVECCTKPVLKWISENAKDIPVNIMAQYRPEAFADPTSPDFDKRAYDIARRPFKRELTDSWKYAEELGLNYKSVTFD